MTEPIVGFSFPFRLEPLEGRVALTSGPEKIKQNLIQIILTSVGERVMRRDYGGGIREFVHEPNGEALKVIVQHQIAKSIAQWEPRVEVNSVNITQQQATFMVDLEYVIRDVQEVQLLSVRIGLDLTV